MPPLTSNGVTIRIDTFTPNEHVISFHLEIDEATYLSNEETFLRQLTTVFSISYSTSRVKRWCIETSTATEERYECFLFNKVNEYKYITRDFHNFYKGEQLSPIWFVSYRKKLKTLYQRAYWSPMKREAKNETVISPVMGPIRFNNINSWAALRKYIPCANSIILCYTWHICICLHVVLVFSCDWSKVFAV